MSVKKDNVRLTITLDKEHKEKLSFLCKFFNLSKTNIINKLIVDMYDKIN